MTLVGLVMLIALTGVAFVDYEMIRADAEAARSDAEVARGNCFGTVAPTIAERKRRNARCERIPDPVGVSKRIERRWEQRRPWYGFAAGAIFLPTALMCVLTRRRRGEAATRDAARSRAWRVVTISTELAVGMVVWAAVFYLVWDRWLDILAIKGPIHDCSSGGDCDALDRLTADHPSILRFLIAVGSVIPAAAVTWPLVRLFHSLDDQRDGRRRLQFQQTDSPSVLS
jgi:hypothetical protein